MFFSLRDKNYCTKNDTNDDHFDPRPKRGFNYLLTGAALFVGAFIFISNPTASIAVVTNNGTNGTTNASCSQTTYNTGSACGSVTFPVTTNGTSASVACPVGCSGTLVRSCSNGSWGAVSGSCTVNRPVKVSGRKLLEDFDRDNVYASYFIKGVVYNPTPVGRYPSDKGNPNLDTSLDNYLDNADILNRDFALLQQMNANTVYIPYANNREIKSTDIVTGFPWTTADIGRFKAKMTMNTLNAAEFYNLKVIAGFDIGLIGEWDRSVNPPVYKTYIDIKNSTVRSKITAKFRDFVRAFKTSPQILFWAIGSGDNLELNPADATQIRYYYMFMNQLAALAHQEEGALYHPVSIVNGELYYLKDYEKYVTTSDVLWGTQVFRGKSFMGLFKEYSALSTKPLWIANFGADAFKSEIDAVTKEVVSGWEHQEAQAKYLGLQWEQIPTHNDVAVGGTVYEFMDQWWRTTKNDDPQINSANHDLTGIGRKTVTTNLVVDFPIGSPFDNYRNEEWFGLFAVQPAPWGMGYDTLVPRAAFYTMAEKFAQNIPPNNDSLTCEQQKALAILEGRTPVPCESYLPRENTTYIVATPKGNTLVTTNKPGTNSHAYDLYITDYPGGPTSSVEARAALEGTQYPGALNAYNKGYQSNPYYQQGGAR